MTLHRKPKQERKLNIILGCVAGLALLLHFLPIGRSIAADKVGDSTSLNTTHSSADLKDDEILGDDGEISDLGEVKFMRQIVVEDEGEGLIDDGELTNGELSEKIEKEINLEDISEDSELSEDLVEEKTNTETESEQGEISGAKGTRGVENTEPEGESEGSDGETDIEIEREEKEIEKAGEISETKRGEISEKTEGGDESEGGVEGDEGDTKGSEGETQGDTKGGKIEEEGRTDGGDEGGDPKAPQIALLLPGSDFNNVLFDLTRGELSQIVTITGSVNARACKVTTIISDRNSAIEVYAIFNGLNGTLTYCTTAPEIYLNASSAGMFEGLTNLTSIKMEDFNTSLVTDMSYMFGHCSSLTGLDLSRFDTRNVTNMSYMFDRCNSLTSLDLTGFNTILVQKMDSMFAGCTSLETIYANFDYSSLKDNGVNMFYNTTNLVGGFGTLYQSEYVDYKLARPDSAFQSGYFTYREVYVSFRNQNYEEFTGEILSIGDTAIAPIVQLREGEKATWYTDSGYTDEFDFDTPIDKYTKLYLQISCDTGYVEDFNGTCVRQVFVTFVANPTSAFSGGHFSGGETTKTLEYRQASAGYYYAVTEEIQVPNLDPVGDTGYMFEGWYTTPGGSTRWIGLTSGNTATGITLYAKYLPFKDKTVTRDGVTFTIMDRNLGATAVSSGYSYNNSTQSSKTRIGLYFQWGNNFGFINSGTISNRLANVYIRNYANNPRGPGNYYFNGIFINTIEYRNSGATSNDNLWGGNSVNNPDTDRQGPCPDGYHVPYSTEWQATRNLFNKWNATEDGSVYCNSLTKSGIQYCLPAVLGLPFAGYRSYTNTDGTTISYRKTRTYYRAANAKEQTRAYNLYVISSSLSAGNYSRKTNGFSVRCFKNTENLTLTFDSKGGSSIASQTGFRRWQERSSNPTNPTRANSTFVGWYKDTGYTDEFVFSSTTYVSEDTTLYAKWECDTGYTAVGNACLDTTAPTCIWGQPSKTELKYGETGSITLTCTDEAGITSHNLSVSDINFSNPYVMLTNVVVGGNGNNKTYTFTYRAVENVNGEVDFILPSGKVSDQAGNRNDEVRLTDYVFQSDGTITVCDPNDSGNCITMQDRNLGAITNDITSTGSYGYHYQWGNNYGFEIGCRTNGCSGQITRVDGSVGDANSYGPNNPYSSGVFYDPTHAIGSYYNWAYPANLNLWGGSGDMGSDSYGYPVTNATDRKGPCSTGYHVPSAGEIHQFMGYWAENYTGGGNENLVFWDDLGASIYNDQIAITQFRQDFKMPFAGSRSSEAKLSNLGNIVKWWTSTPGNDSYGYYFQLYEDDAYTHQSPLYSALSVRCFKDTPTTGFTKNSTIVVDSIVPDMIFTGSTPAHDSTQGETYFTSQIEITESNLSGFKSSFDGVQTSLYDDSLILMYNFDNVQSLGEGTTLVKDWSRYGRDGIVHGAISISKGKYGGAFSFDGVDDYIDFEDYGPLNENGTISVWAKGALTNDLQILIGNGTGLIIGLNRSSLIGWVGSTTNKKPSGLVSNYDNNGWNHIVVSNNSGTLSYYINGKLLEPQIDNFFAWDYSGGSIGKRVSDTLNNHPFSGQIDEIRVYNRALSLNEIQALYRSNLAKIDTDKWTYIIGYTGLAGGTYSYGGSASDMIGNESTIIRTINIDTSAPTVTLSSPNPEGLDCRTSEYIYTITGVFSEAVTGLDISTLFVTNGTVQSFNMVSGDTAVWTVTKSNSGDYIYGANISGVNTLTVCDPNDSGACITMMDRNLGAVQAGTGCSVSNSGVCGYHYQRGNNHGFKTCLTNSCTDMPGGEIILEDTPIDTSIYGPGNYYSGNVLRIVIHSDRGDWSSIRNDNLRGGSGDNQSNNWGLASTNSITDRQGPCPEGYHIPSIGEWDDLLEYWVASRSNLTLSGSSPYYSVNFDIDTNQLANDFKFPYGGNRGYTNGKTYNIGSYDSFWTSSPHESGDEAYRLRLTTNEAIVTSFARAYPLSLRCFKDESLVPTIGTVTVLIETGAVQDLAGNTNTEASNTITWNYDDFGPTGSIDVTYSGSDTYATGTTFTLTLSASDEGCNGTVSQMQFSCDGSSWTPAETFATTKTFSLADYTSAGCTTGDGLKTIYVRYIDELGNTGDVYSDSIIVNRLSIILQTIATGANQTLKINKYFANAYTVDRGDGSTGDLTADTTHTYNTAGTYTIVLSLSGASRWTFQNVSKPLVQKAGTTVTGVQITYMPSLAEGFGDSATNPGDHFFRYFNGNGSLTSLPEGSFDTSKITTVGDYFFYYFNYNGSLTSLPEQSFDISNISGTVGNYFFAYFNGNGSLTSLPEGSFDTSNITTVGNNFFADFNHNGELTSLSTGSFDTSNITTAGSNFFYNFNNNGQLTSLPDNSFDTSNITSVGTSFFVNFNYYGVLTSLPEGSFRLSTGLTTVTNSFFTNFNSRGSLTSLPEGSFDTSNITTAGSSFFGNFNSHGSLTSLPEGSFDTSNITTAGSSFFGNFNDNGELTSLPDNSFDTSNITTIGNNFFSSFNYNGKIMQLPNSFTMNSTGATVTGGYNNAFNSSNYTLNRNVSDLVSGVTPPSSDRDTFSDNQPKRCGVDPNWLDTTADACSITYNPNGGNTAITTKNYDSDTTGVVAGSGITTPTRANSQFVGWYTGIQTGNQVTTVLFPAMDSGTLYAFWSCDTGYKISGDACILNKDIVLQATATAANQKLKINKYFANAYTVDRGDGTTGNLTADTTHTYSTAGTYTITLSLSGADRWTFKNQTSDQPLVLSNGTTMTGVKIVFMPSLADGFGNSATNPGNYFFMSFNKNGAITSLPEGSFDTSNITTAGDYFFMAFNEVGLLRDLPAGSFRLSTGLTTVGDYFFGYFNNSGKLVSLPAGSFNIGKISSAGSNFFRTFNQEGSLESLPDGSFRLSTGLTVARDGFFAYFDNNGKLESLPDGSFDISNITSAGSSFFHGFNAMGKITSLPAGSFRTDNIVTVGDDFFAYFNFEGKLESLPTLSFNTSNISGSVGNNFFMQFNAKGSLTSLPAGSFNISNISGTVGNNFFYAFNYLGSIESLPEGSFDASKITTAGEFFFGYFNMQGSLTSLPAGSFNVSNITATTNYPFYAFNYLGAIEDVPTSFTISPAGVSANLGYAYAFYSPNYTINRNVSDLVSGVVVPLDDRDTFSDNQPGRCGVHPNWLYTTADACSITYDSNGGSTPITTNMYTADTTGVVAGSGVTTPTRVDYEFVGRYTGIQSGDLVTTVLFPAMDSGTLYAHWRETVPPTVVISSNGSGMCAAPTDTYIVTGVFSEDVIVDEGALTVINGNVQDFQVVSGNVAVWTVGKSSGYIYKLRTGGINTLTICDPNDSTSCITMMDRNLGATTKDITSTGSYGYHYQWGNNHGFSPCYDSVGCTRFPGGEIVQTFNNANIDGSSYGPSQYGTGLFVRNDGWSSAGDWSKVRNDNLWGGNGDESYGYGLTSSNPITDREGPCGTGYHVPSAGELSMLLVYWAANYTGMGNLLTINGTAPLQNITDSAAVNQFRRDFNVSLAGNRSEYSTTDNLGAGGGWWSSSPKSNRYAYNVGLSSSKVDFGDSNGRSIGFSVRCFKDTPIIPESNDDTEVLSVVIETGAFGDLAGNTNTTGSNTITWEYDIQGPEVEFNDIVVPECSDVRWRATGIDVGCAGMTQNTAYSFGEKLGNFEWGGPILHISSDDIPGARVHTQYISVRDNYGNATTASATITVTDTAPTANDFSVDDVGAGINVDVRWKDESSATDGLCGSETLTGEVISSGTQGECTIEDNHLFYTPNPGASGSDTCTILITDDEGSTGSFTVTWNDIYVPIPQITFVSPTPDDEVVRDRNRFISKVEISQVENLSYLGYGLYDVNHDYNVVDRGVNPTGYKIFNFDNVTELGEVENESVMSIWGDEWTVSGATRVSSGRYGGAYSFDGIDDSFDSLLILRYGAPVPYSFALWVKPEGGEWTHIVYTYSPEDGEKYYVNGREDSLPDELYNAFNIFSRGGRTSYVYLNLGYNDDQYFTGLIDEVIVFDYTLYEEDVQYLYKSNLRRTGPDTWEFEVMYPCLDMSGSYEYSVDVESTIGTSASTGRNLTTQISITVDGTGYDFGTHVSTGSVLTLTGTMGTVTVTDYVGQPGWRLYFTTSPYLVGQDTQQTISTENLMFKASGLVYSGLYGLTETSHVHFNTRDRISMYTSAASGTSVQDAENSPILEYFVRHVDNGNDWLCEDVGTYSDDTQIMLEVPAWQVEDVYTGTLWITLQIDSYEEDEGGGGGGGRDPEVPDPGTTKEKPEKEIVTPELTGEIIKTGGENRK